MNYGFKSMETTKSVDVLFTIFRTRFSSGMNFRAFRARESTKFFLSLVFYDLQVANESGLNMYNIVFVTPINGSFFKGTLMQIWKFHYMFGFIHK